MAYLPHVVKALWAVPLAGKETYHGFASVLPSTAWLIYKLTTALPIAPWAVPLVGKEIYKFLIA